MNQSDLDLSLINASVSREAVAELLGIDPHEVEGRLGDPEHERTVRWAIERLRVADDPGFLRTVPTRSFLVHFITRKGRRHTFEHHAVTLSTCVDPIDGIQRRIQDIQGGAMRVSTRDGALCVRVGDGYETRPMTPHEWQNFPATLTYPSYGELRSGLARRRPLVELARLVDWIWQGDPELGHAAARAFVGYVRTARRPLPCLELWRASQHVDFITGGDTARRAAAAHRNEPLEQELFEWPDDPSDLTTSKRSLFGGLKMQWRGLFEPSTGTVYPCSIFTEPGVHHPRIHELMTHQEFWTLPGPGRQLE